MQQGLLRQPSALSTFLFRSEFSSHLMTVGTRIETSWETSKGRRAPAFSLAAQARGPHWLLGSRSEAFREQVEVPQKASYGEGCARDFDPGRGSLLLQPPSLCAGACSPSSQHGARSGRGTEHAGRGACFRGQDRRRSKGAVREVLPLLERNRLDLRRLCQAPPPSLLSRWPRRSARC